MAKKRKYHLIKGWVQYKKQPIPKEWLTEKVLSKPFRQLLEEKGVYVLYKEEGHHFRPFYIGIAGFGEGKNLFARLKSHAENRKTWTHFMAFIIPVSEKKKRTLKDIEGVLIRIVDPEANKSKPMLIEGGYQKKISQIIKTQLNEIKERIQDINKKQRSEERRMKKRFKRIMKTHKKEQNRFRAMLSI